MNVPTADESTVLLTVDDWQRVCGCVGEVHEALDRPKRRCSNCGRTFQPTVQRRMLCANCYRRGDPEGEE